MQKVSVPYHQEIILFWESLDVNVSLVECDRRVARNLGHSEGQEIVLICDSAFYHKSRGHRPIAGEVFRFFHVFDGEGRVGAQINVVQEMLAALFKGNRRITGHETCVVSQQLTSSRGK